MSVLFAFLDGLGAPEMLVVAVLAVLLFGERLPEVGRKLAKNLTEFKRSIRGIQEEFTGALTGVENSISSSATPTRRNETVEDRDEATAPKFVPPPHNGSEPQAELTDNRGEHLTPEKT